MRSLRCNPQIVAKKQVNLTFLILLKHLIVKKSIFDSISCVCRLIFQYVNPGSSFLNCHKKSCAFNQKSTAFIVLLGVIGEFDHHQIQSIFEKSDLQDRLDHVHGFYRLKYRSQHQDHIQTHLQSALRH